MWSSPQKIFPWRSPLKKVGLSTVAPCHSPLFKLIITKNVYKLCDRPLKKFFSVTLASQKWVSRLVAPFHSASIQVDNEKCYKYVIVPQKNFLRDARSQKWVSRQSPRDTLPLFKLIITKNVISMWSSLKNFSPWRSPLKSGSLDSRPVTLASIQVDNHEKML